MTRQSRVLIAVAVFGVGLLVGGTRQADAGKKRIAVLEIEGARTGQLRGDVVKLVKTKHRVLTVKAFERAKRKVKARKLNTAGVKKVAKELRLDGVVEGMLVAEDDGYVLRLRLRAGSTGKTVRKFTVFLSSPRMPAKIRKQLRAKLHKAIATLKPVVADEPSFDRELDNDADDRAERRRAKKERAKRAKKDRAKKKRAKKERAKKERAKKERAKKERAKKKRAKRSRARDLIGNRDIEAISDDDDDDFDDDDDDDDFDDDDDDFGDDDDDDDEDDDDDDDFDNDDRSDRSDGAPNARTLGISLSAGVSVIGRTLAFTAREDLAAPPSEYAGAFAPGAYLTGEFYPLAMSGGGESAAANIGFGFAVERSVGLSSQVADSGMQPVNLATQRQRYGVRALYRHNFGSKDTHPTATLGVGYNKLGFAIDRTNLPAGVVIDVPDVEYTYVDPGLTLRLPVGPKLAFIAEGKFMGILDAGTIVMPDNYGQATVTGFDGDVAVEYRPGAKLIVRAGAHVTTVGFAFQEGAGQMSSNRDGDLATLDVGGALDRYVGGYLTAGYIY